MAESTKTDKLESLDVSKLRLEDVDILGHDALKDAVKSVIRSGLKMNMVQGHKDHRSHSST